ATPSPTVQWQSSTDGSGWNNIGGATALTYTFTATLADSGHQYRAVFNNTCGSTNSGAATLTVQAQTPASPNMVTWGTGSYGQLGNGSSTNNGAPAAVAALPGDRKAVAVAAGFDHSLALADDGTVWAWGHGQSGQLGNGTFNA